MNESTSSRFKMEPSPTTIDLSLSNKEEDDHANKEVTKNEKEERNYLVYCLVSTVHPQQTYVGSTNNWTRRIRQHNGFIKGGARRTQGHRPWAPLFHVVGLTKTEALQLEWALKHRRKKGHSGPRGRINTLEFLLFGGTVDKWTQRAPSMKSMPENTLQLVTPYSFDKWSSLCLLQDRPLKQVPFCVRNFDKEIPIPQK